MLHSDLPEAIAYREIDPASINQERDSLHTYSEKLSNFYSTRDEDAHINKKILNL